MNGSFIERDYVSPPPPPSHHSASFGPYDERQRWDSPRDAHWDEEREMREREAYMRDRERMEWEKREREKREREKVETRKQDTTQRKRGGEVSMEGRKRVRTRTDKVAIDRTSF